VAVVARLGNEFVCNAVYRVARDVYTMHIFNMFINITITHAKTEH